MISLTASLSEGEIGQLDEFLMSDATPEECMDISALDGFLTSLVIGPGLIPPSLWLKAIWGGESEPMFESSAQAQRVIRLIMRRFNAISSMFNEPPEFAPILYEHEVEGTLLADAWCWGFLAGIRLAPEGWQPLLEDEDTRRMLLPIIVLGNQDGWELLETDVDPKMAAQAALDDVESAVVEISRFWRGEWRRQSAVLHQSAIRPRTLRVGRNESCPCGSGRKYKRCCANGEG
jgi:uncharacterized protein